MTSRRILSAGFSFFTVALLAGSFLARQTIFDEIRLHNYQPPQAIVQLADHTTMKTSARRLFYVYHPELDGKEDFSNHCPNQSEKTIVLGCYVSQRGIYLYKVTDTRLSGVEEVTAAHETLHAAYDRLSSKDKKHVGDMINRAYAQLKDERIRSTIDSYRSSGADTTNELHSILGTEVRDLPADLEAYYARYFNDRKKIVSYSEQYEKAFTDLKAAAQSYLDQMKALEAQLSAMHDSLTVQETDLKNQYNQLQRERQTTTSPAAFNAKVEAYNAAVEDYHKQVIVYNELVQEHNDLLKKYNAIALEENELIKALDSHPSTVQPQQ